MPAQGRHDIIVATATGSFGALPLRMTMRERRPRNKSGVTLIPSAAEGGEDEGFAFAHAVEWD